MIRDKWKKKWLQWLAMKAIEFQIEKIILIMNKIIQLIINQLIDYTRNVTNNTFSTSYFKNRIKKIKKKICKVLHQYCQTQIPILMFILFIRFIYKYNFWMILELQQQNKAFNYTLKTPPTITNNNFSIKTIQSPESF